MKTKREVLEIFAESGNCTSIKCSDCPYRSDDNCNGYTLHESLTKLGAKLMLKTLPKIEFDINNILTCVTADQAKVGTRGYFGDDLTGLKLSFENNELYELLGVNAEDNTYRFKSEHNNFALFYPIDEVEVIGNYEVREVKE